MMHVTLKWAGSLQVLGRFMFDFDYFDAPYRLQTKAAEAMGCEVHAARVVYSNADLNLDLVLRPRESHSSTNHIHCLEKAWTLFKPVLKNIKASATTSDSEPCITLLVTQFSQTSLWIHYIAYQNWSDAPAKFQTLPEQARKTRCVALAAVEKNSRCFKFVCPTLQSNRDFVLAAVKRNSFAADFVKAEFLNDHEVARAAYL